VCWSDQSRDYLDAGLAFYVPAVTSLVAGTMFLMWLGEQITERGVGNGISMIIFAGIVAGLPNMVLQFFSVDSQTSLIGVVFGCCAAVLAAIVFIEKAQRRIPVNYAKTTRSSCFYCTANAFAIKN
jgi:preprotein translocase subunit SecY